MTQAPAGYKECFLKRDCRKDAEGYINIKKKEPTEGHFIDPEKVNRDFNGFGTIKR